MAIAACVGFFYSQIAFTHYIKDDILKEETQAIARSNIAIEKEWITINNAKVAQENGVTFYADRIEIPAPKKTLGEIGNETVFIYPKSKK